MSIKGMLFYTFEYDTCGKYDPGFVELQVHFAFRPGCEAQIYGDPSKCYPAESYGVDYDYAEIAVERDGKEIFERLKPGEWLDEWCQSWLASLDEAHLAYASISAPMARRNDASVSGDLIEGLPNGGERDPDDDRDARFDRERD